MSQPIRMVTFTLSSVNPLQVLSVNSWTQVTFTHNGDRNISLFASNPVFGAILPSTAGMNLPSDAPLTLILAPGSSIYAATNGPVQTFSAMIQDLPDFDGILKVLNEISQKLGPSSQQQAQIAPQILPKKRA